MNDRERIAAIVAGRWPAGQCHYCHILDERIDGDRIRWIDQRRNVCSRCVRAFHAEIDRAIARMLRPKRKMTPAEVHELIRRKKRGNRAGAGSRRKSGVA